MVQYASTGYLFQSTLSVRRATAARQIGSITHRISIHALREESDHFKSLQITAITDFNPRSP